MKNSELIEKLQAFPPDMEVCVLDWQLNADEDSAEGSGAGIYSSFDVEEITFVTEESKPVVALSFTREENEPAVLGSATTIELIEELHMRAKAGGYADNTCER